MSMKSAFLGVVLALGLSSAGASASTLKLISPGSATYVQGTDFTDFAFSGEGTATGHLAFVSNFGCLASDFASFTAGSIALIDRGTCLFRDKVVNAFSAGAIGVLVRNNNPSLSTGSLITPQSIPAQMVSQSLGTILFNTPDAVMTMTVGKSPSTVPLPAALPLLGFALGAMGVAGWRKRR